MLTKATARATRSQCSRRCLHVTAQVRAASEVDEKSGVRKRGKRIQLYRWLDDPDGGLSYSSQQSGVNWLGDNIPFPNNPTFRPVPPIPDENKTEIYNAFVIHKKSPRQIAEDQRISIKRVEAIIRLKALENDFAKQNKPIQKPFVKAMDEMLGARRRSLKEADPVAEVTQQIGRPTFAIREEDDQSISETEAAQILRTKSLHQIEESILKREQWKPFRLQQVAKVQETRQVFPKNPVESNARFNFVFVDTSKTNRQSTKIRTQDGSLKEIVQK